MGEAMYYPIRRWLKAWQERRNIRRYVKGYQRHPESLEEIRALQQASMEALAKEFQDEPPWIS